MRGESSACRFKPFSASAERSPYLADRIKKWSRPVAIFNGHIDIMERMTKHAIETPTGKLLPVRVRLGHCVPPFVTRTTCPVFFITVACANRTEQPLIPHADAILDSVRTYTGLGKWFPDLFLVMPDHVHGLMTFEENLPLAKAVGEWKRFLNSHFGIEWQQGFFDTRIRNDEHFREKWNYIRMNPVAKGLVDHPNGWPWRLSYNRQTGGERPMTPPPGGWPGGGRWGGRTAR